jgi:hypothetical protein
MDFLWSKLDFEIGKHFEKNLQRSTGRCIHDSVANDSGFHLLTTFRRYLFQLNEESVAIALSVLPWWPCSILLCFIPEP